MKQFGRSIQLTIGNSSESIVIDGGLSIEFDLTKTITSDPNEATISVTNLSQATRNIISDGTYDRVELRAGYSTDLRVLFVGYIDEVLTQKNGVDIVTTVRCSDGASDYRTARIAVTVSKGSTDEDIIKQCISSMPETGTGITSFAVVRALTRGKTMVGNVRDILSNVSKNQDADWSIQDNQLTLLPKTHALANDEGFILSQETGMIGSPSRTTNGIEVRCLLNNIMKVGQLCRVESFIKEYSGDFKITKIQMRGGNRVQDFTNILELQNGQFNEVNK